MQPKTKIKFDEESFNRLKRTIRNMSVTDKERHMNSKYATEVPDEVGIQLTYKCNLRCKHCFEWSEDGFCTKLDKEEQLSEIDLDVLQRIFDETKERKSNMYIWGGEPFCYSNWDKFVDILSKDKRWTVLCTNGTMIDKKLDSILKISDTLALLISLDGFQVENDNVRGKGTFNKVIENIKMLVDLKKKGIYKGEISVNCVITDEMVDKLYDFMEYFEEIGVNTVYFCFPWYIPKETAEKMDIYFKENFAWLNTLDEKSTASWHSYTYGLNSDLIDTLEKELEKINNRVWKIRIRIQPAVEPNEIRPFAMGQELPAQHRTTCLAMSNRMNIEANGNVVMCKMFPEFKVGNINEGTVKEIWHNDIITKCREKIGCGLMPICSKCILLYLHGK